ncbi:MAG: complex I NDUFA9 subunit family protein [Azospirillaceae bacterium]|nr:complex I NDUFA9 subunit family protein [Azospirillaceae bacterium]
MGFHSQVITVFGGSGFLGRHLVRRLAKTGATIRIATRHPSRAGFLKTAGAVGQIVPIAVDTDNDDSVAAALVGADFAVNLIGILAPHGRITFQSAHVDAADRVARIAAAAAVQRLVHVSALGADEASPSVYARTKAQGERAVLKAFPGATVLRPSVMFGPEDDFFNRFAAMALYFPALPLIGKGTTRLQPVYVGDVAEAIMVAGDNPSCAGKTYVLGGPLVYTLREIMARVETETGHRRALVPIPWGLATTLAGLLEWLPNPPLTRDQVALLQTDNVVPGGANGLVELGIAPTAIDLILPTYLARFRTGGTPNRRQTAS